MAKIRKSVPRELENVVLYKSARTCCVCRIPRAPVEIHHIDQDPSNNVENNLVAICRNCHDEAHTSHSMSKNLTKSRLIDAKERWEVEVKSLSNAAMHQKSHLGGMVWTFVNHQLIPQLMKAYSLEYDKKTLKLLKMYGVVDHNGLPIFQKKPSSKEHVTIYDRVDWDHAHRLHYMYTQVIDDLIDACSPIELGAVWSKKEIVDLIKPGVICFCIRGFRFRRNQVINQEEDRYVYAKASDVEIRMYANSRYMFGISSLYVNFAGHKFTTVLMLVKNVAKEDGIVVINATPIAMGTGFSNYEQNTPHKLKYRWAGNA